MGREVRHVPANWQHPKNERGCYVALLGGSFAADLSTWQAEKAKWDEGLVRDYSNNGWKARESGRHDGSYEEWSGERPEAGNYMPDWPEAERTHLQMYENTSEGTPISPVMATPEELARWLADNRASAFGNSTATYDQWLATIRAGWAVSAVIENGVFRSGVEASA